MDESVADGFANLAIELHGQRTLSRTVEQIVRYAVTAVGCDFANVIFFDQSRQVREVASTHPVAARIAQIMAEYGEGPALALSDEPGSHLIVHDTASETRWPRWRRELLTLGVHSVLCTRLATRISVIGALALYSKEPLGFDNDDIAVAHILARHASVALAAARQQHAIAQRIDARKQIGQAQGMLMERFRLDADGAFELLRRYSQQHDLKLNEVARRLVLTREMPREDNQTGADHSQSYGSRTGS